MACFMGGSVIGFVALSAVNIRPAVKRKLFIAASIISNVLIITALNQPYFLLMAVLVVLAGITNSVVNVLLISTVQARTPQAMRGKVMSFMHMTTSGLMPFAAALGGVLGGILPIRLVMTVSFGMGFLITVPAYFSHAFKDYLTADNPAEASA